ncbi:MAG: hypothetical protein ACFCBW_05895 [Candidatus Competibacterales bacterium]
MIAPVLTKTGYGLLSPFITPLGCVTLALGTLSGYLLWEVTKGKKSVKDLRQDMKQELTALHAAMASQTKQVTVAASQSQAPTEHGPSDGIKEGATNGINIGDNDTNGDTGSMDAINDPKRAMLKVLVQRNIALRAL